MQEKDLTDISSDNERLISVIFQRSSAEVIIGLIAVLAVVVVMWNKVENTLITYWVLSASIVYFSRFFLGKNQTDKLPQSSHTLLFLILVFFSGVIWGAASYLAFLQNSTILQASIITWIVSICFFITLIYSGHISSLLAFIVPSVGITTLTLLEQVSPWNTLVSNICIGIGLLLIIFSLVCRNVLTRGLYSQADNQQLLSQNKLLLEKSKKLEVSLKTSEQNNNELEEKLEETIKKLDQCESSKGSLANSLKTNIRTDPITNLSNRKEFLETVTQEWQRSSRRKEPLTIAFINVDHFDSLAKGKDRNTVLSTLKKVGQTIKAHGRRAGDMPARVDKAGFALLLLGADSKNASKIIERVRSSIHDKNIITYQNGEPLTVHAGVATLVPNTKTTPAEMLQHVESAAYEAKFQGGDRVISFHALNDISISVWDQMKDGALNEANFEQKLLRKGYNTSRQIIKPRTTFRDQSFSSPTAFAVYSGIFLITIEGQEYELRHGMSLVLPKNISFSAEVVGEEPIILYVEKR